MPSERRRHVIPEGFSMSPDVMQPSDFMRGNVPDMIRSGRVMRGNQLTSNCSSGRDRRSPIDSIVPTHKSFFDNDFDSILPSFHGGHFGFSNMLQSMSNLGGGSVYQSSMTVMSSYVDENGERKTERYKKAAYGNNQKDMHEVCEAYSNSSTGRDIMACERRDNTRGLQWMRQRDANTQVVEETRQPINLDESEVEHFNRAWLNEFEPIFPQLKAAQSTRRALDRPRRRQLQQ